MNNKAATTFHDAIENLETDYPKIDVKKEARFVDNGKIITTTGISAGIDGALHLVAKLKGINTAKRTAYYMEYDNWNIGDGLILTKNTPYKETINTSNLKNFEGKYEYINEKQITIFYNKKENTLNALIDKINYPIYHEYDDVFSDVTNHAIIFKRNKTNKIIGYSINENEKIFKKLN